MEKYELKRPDSFKKKTRVGCGPASGKGKTAGRGMNGQRSRSGSKRRAWFEGGQMPLQRRVPKRGFNNIFKKYYQIVNLSQIEKFAIDNVDSEFLKQNGIIKNSNKRIKVLGNGEISRSVKIIADAFSASAIEKIKSAGGEAVIRDFPGKPKKNDKKNKTNES